MKEDLIGFLLDDTNYLFLYGLVFFYFLVLYFTLAPLFDFLCRKLELKGLVHKITDKPIPPGQIRFEIKHSLSSILVFGFSVWPVIYLYRIGIVAFLENSVLNVLLGILVLNVWNELHFFTVHRLMHTRFFMKRVHYIHHKSFIPTVYSVYSFHWFEALLLSTVPLTLVLILPVAPIALLLYPVTSLIINLIGHSNYRIGNGTGETWKLLATNHNAHHAKGKQNFGFASNLLDVIYSKFTFKK